MTINPREVEFEDLASLRSAQGYYELGMVAESQAALQRLPVDDRTRPETLELQILLCLDQKEWRDAIQICLEAIELYPKMPFGFVNHAYAEHELGHTQAALEILEKAHLVVAVEPTAVYNRGCYLACLGRHAEAVFWINKALRLDPKLQTWAAKDPDLNDIRSQLDLEL